MAFVRSIDGVDFVFGMNWMPLSRDEEEPAVVRSIAERRKAQAMVLHKERESHCLGLSSEDTVGVVSAASSAARKRKGSWISVFMLEAGQYWLIGASNGAVVSGTDKIYTSGTDAVTEMSLLARLVDFTETFVAEGILGEDSEYKSIPVTEVLDQSAGTRSVSPNQTIVDRLRDGRRLVSKWIREHKLLSALMLTTAFVGHQGYQRLETHWAEQEALQQQEAAKDAEDEAAKARDAEREAQINAANANWISRPSAEEYQEICRAGIRTVSLPIAGWEWTRRRCGIDAAVSFEKTFGLRRRVESSAEVRGATITWQNNDRAEIARPLVFSDTTRNQTLIGASEGRLLFEKLQREQSLAARITPLQKVEQGDLLETVLRRSRITIQDVADTAELAKKLDLIPGLVIREMTKSDEALWTIELEIYHEDDK